MKKLTQLFMSLMLFLGVGTAFADVIPPTFNPAPGSTVQPGKELKVSVDQQYASATPLVMVWTFDASKQSSLADLDMTDNDAIQDVWDGGYPGLNLSMRMSISQGVEGDVEGVVINNWLPGGPMVPNDAQGNITLYYRFMDNLSQSTSVLSANYTVAGEVIGIPVPVFDPAQGPVEAGSKVTLSVEAAEGFASHGIAYVLNNENFDFTQYTDAFDIPTHMLYNKGIVINETTTITAATYKDDFTTESISGWSEKVTVTYTIAGGEDPEPTTPEVLAAPTYTPASGSTVNPGDEITFDIPTDYQSYMAYLLYTTNESAFASATTYEGKVALAAEVLATDDETGDPTYTGPVMMAGYMNGNWLMPCKIPNNATAGALTLKAFLFIPEGEIVSEIATASYTVAISETPGEEIQAPVFNPNGGAVKAGTRVKLEVSDEYPNDEYWLYYVIDDPDFDFSQYTTDEEVEEAGAQSSYGTVLISKACTVKAALCHVNQGFTTTITAWSAPVTATFTIEEPDPENDIPMPVFNPAGGAVPSGTHILLTNGTESDATPKPIYYNFKANDAAETAFKSLKTKAALDAEVVKQPSSLRKANTYEATGIELTEGKTISAATADIDASGNVTWSTVVTQVFTIGTATPIAPVFNPDGGDVQRGNAITLTKTNTGEAYDIYYSFSSSDDVFNVATVEALGSRENAGTLIMYTGGIVLENDATIKAAVVRTNDDETLTWSDVVTKSFTLVGEAPRTVAVPVIMPATDAYVHIGDTVKITCATEEALLYYTADGSAPYTTDARGEEYTGVSDNAILYTGPFALTSDMLIKQNTVWALKIRAVAQNGNAIKVAGVGYNVLPNTPTFSIPTGSEVREGREVAIACVPTQADIYYTTDGSTPTMENSPKYTGPIAVTSAMTIKALAVLGQYQSSVVSASYTLKTEADPDEVILSFNPASGTEVDENKAIAITSNKEDVDIFYMMFSSAAEAYAAAWDQEEAELYSAEMRPVVSTEKNTIKAAYARQGADAIGEEFFYATYTVKTLPPVTLTFDPASGAEVEEGTEITVTASRETEIFYNVYPDRLAADTDELFMVNAMEVTEDGMPVITAAKPYLRCGVYEKGQMKYFSASYTVIFSIRFNPASGAEVEEGTAISIIAPGNVDLFYMMYESEEAAKAAEWNQEEAELYSAEMKPVVSAEKNTIKVAYALEGAEALADTFFYATYKVTAPADITLTFDPASGAEVEEGTEITVTASRETEIFYNVYADSAAAKADTTFIVTSKEVAEDGKPVITKGNTYLLCAVYDKGEMKYFAASYTIKEESANEGLELQGVSIYPNPSDGRFVIELPVNATVEVFAASGALIRNFTATAGKTTLTIGQSGIYFVRIAGEGRSTVKRVIVR